MRNTVINTQNNRQTANVVEMNAMSNSMAMLLIYHGLSANTEKNSTEDNEIISTKPTR
ncbi:MULTISPECIES: hypothetical protein [unclassified Providencia]|uniref:hypothetical protein n=1 Tax=unclassified Providencia TaxID=2633465 RepID=UPI001C5A5D84|nr:hypothetical protein [Providencia sp. R33]QXX82412.1 hypothetical protein J6836_19710 [Providencia sp. R33]